MFKCINGTQVNRDGDMRVSVRITVTKNSVTLRHEHTALHPLETLKELL